jgi:DNA repair protein RadD
MGAGHRRICQVLSTGAGKTIVAATHIKEVVGQGDRVLFLSHRREITGQTSRKLHDRGVDHGIIQAGFPSRPGERVQVASVQTLHARAIRGSALELPPANFVFVDECHHTPARSYRQILEAYPEAVIIGMTATPCRGDGRGLGADFELLVEGPQAAELIELKALVPPIYYAPTMPDLSGVRVARGDYVEKDLAERVDRPELVGDVVTNWLRLGERRPTVIFASSVSHSVHLRDRFRDASIVADHIDGSTPAEERDQTLVGLADGTVEVVTNYGVLTEGWDCPEASCLVLARPTKHLGLNRQMVGRGLRPAPGKDDCIILDHAGGIYEHGLVTEDVTWTLEEDRRAVNPAHAARQRYDAPRLTICPECGAVRSSGRACPVCHWQPRPKPEPVEFVDGDLGRVDRQRVAAAAAYDQSARQLFHAQLAYIALERGTNLAGRHTNTKKNSASGRARARWCQSYPTKPSARGFAPG